MLSASPRSFAEHVRFTVNGAEMDYCRVVGPRGLCRPLDEKQGLPTNTSPLAPCKGCSKAGKNNFSRLRQGWRGRPPRPVSGICQVGGQRIAAPSDRPRRSGAPDPPAGTPRPPKLPRPLGPWILPGWGPRPPWGYPPRPPKKPKTTSMGSIFIA